MIEHLKNKETAISVIGLGYVGLPLALEFAKKYRVIAFDINDARVQKMKNHEDPSKELPSSSFEGCDVEFTSDPNLLSQASFHIIAVPTPVDKHKVPDLNPVKSASKTLGMHLHKGDIVVYESTVYPGCTEEDCVPILEKQSGLKSHDDFAFGYSPERINPGDTKHTLTKIIKIVSGSDSESLEIISNIYSSIVDAGIYKAKSVKVAEAAKVIENTQRDINISFVNELSIIFDKMGIDTKEVLDAAGTKWNFLPFRPGLVGGHCIGVDPYYLAYKSQKLGYNPEIILAGRRINDSMPSYIAKKMVQKLIEKGKNPANCRLLVLGVTFKENVSDIRNSKVFDLIRELEDYSISVDALDPHASKSEVLEEYNIVLESKISGPYDGIILAVDHKDYVAIDEEELASYLNGTKILFDLKSAKKELKDTFEYWSL
jgi:UDP-N-acetyl-D-galactosamine dehydrogenase